MSKLIYGNHIGRVKVVSLEAFSGTDGKDWNVLKILFDAIKALRGTNWLDIEPVEVSKTYFLSVEPVTKGKFAGKTSLELTRNDLKTIFGYEGNLDEAKLNASLVGQEARIDCQPRKSKDGSKEFNEVKWVNSLTGGQQQAAKKIDPATLAKLDAQFSNTGISNDEDLWGKA